MQRIGGMYEVLGAAYKEPILKIRIGFLSREYTTVFRMHTHTHREAAITEREASTLIIRQVLNTLSPPAKIIIKSRRNIVTCDNKTILNINIPLFLTHYDDATERVGHTIMTKYVLD